MITFVTFSNFLHFLCAILIYTQGTSIDGIGNLGAIFLRGFRLYMLSFMFRFMFANICFEKNQNRKIHVMFIINIT